VLGNRYLFSLEKNGDFWKLIDFQLIVKEESKVVSASEKKITTEREINKVISSSKPIQTPKLEKPKNKSYSFVIFLSGYLLGVFSFYCYSIGD
jgi:hypothetical protein